MSERTEFIAFDGFMGSFDEVFERNNEEILQRATAIESPDSEIANLEWRVCEAAIAKRKAELKQYPSGVGLSVSRYAFAVHIQAEEVACDALIAAREKESNG